MRERPKGPSSPQRNDLLLDFAETSLTPNAATSVHAVFLTLRPRHDVKIAMDFVSLSGDCELSGFRGQ